MQSDLQALTLRGLETSRQYPAAHRAFILNCMKRITAHTHFIQFLADYDSSVQELEMVIANSPEKTLLFKDIREFRLILVALKEKRAQLIENAHPENVEFVLTELSGDINRLAQFLLPIEIYQHVQNPSQNLNPEQVEELTRFLKFHALLIRADKTECRRVREYMQGPQYSVPVYLLQLLPAPQIIFGTLFTLFLPTSHPGATTAAQLKLGGVALGSAVITAMQYLLRDKQFESKKVLLENLKRNFDLEEMNLLKQCSQIYNSPFDCANCAL